VRELPPAWTWAFFDDVADVDSNLVDPKLFPDLPHIAPNHIESQTGRLLPYTTVRVDGVKSSKHLFRAGHILYSKIRPYLAKAVVVSFEGLCSADMYPVSTVMEPRFVHRWLISPEFTAIASTKQGRSVLPKINREDLGRLPVPVPPLNEQRRIVAAMEEHLSRLDAADNVLAAASLRLAALTAAVRLTSIGSAWPTQSLGTVTVNFDGRRVPVKAGDRAKRSGPYPYYGASGVIDSVDAFLFDGDYLLIAEDGANLISRSKPIAFRASGRFWVNNHAHVVQTIDQLEQRFLEVFLNGADLSGLITGTAQPKLTQANLNKVRVPLPPLEEQRRIVAEVEARLSAIDALRAAIERAQRRSSSLRRAILERAFRGELVAQDPSDEPAAVLLERIKAERAATVSPHRSRRVQT
jgi:type I restriction enzyme S subunit